MRLKMTKNQPIPHKKITFLIISGPASDYASLDITRELASSLDQQAIIKPIEVVSRLRLGNFNDCFFAKLWFISNAILYIVFLFHTYLLQLKPVSCQKNRPLIG